MPQHSQTPPPPDDRDDTGSVSWPPARQAIAAVGWCSFLAACLASLLFFALLDPLELLGSEPSLLSAIWSNRTAAYTIGFLFFWFISAVAAALSVYLVRTSREGDDRRPPP